MDGPGTLNHSSAGQYGATQTGDKEAAIRACQSEVEHNPASAEAYYKLGKPFLAHSYSRADDAAKALHRAVQLRPASS